MARVRKKSLTNDEEQDTSQRKGKRKVSVSFEEDDDEVGLDEFEVDGFLVDNDEDEDGGDEEEMLKKKKRKRSLKGIVLDDDDLELIRENKNISQEKLSDGKFKRLKKTGVDTKQMEDSSDDEGSLFDDFSENESNGAEDDLGDFIVDDEVGSYGKGDSLRQKKLKETKQSSLLSKKAKRGSGKAGSPGEQNGSDDHKNMYVAGEGISLADTDIPERLQIIEDILGSIPVDRASIEEESSWILCQITSSIHPLFSAAKSCGLVDAVNREDIVRFLELHHIKKYDIPFIAMYRKEQCPSLLQVPKEEESEDTLLNDCESKPKLNQHKILWIIKELDKKWLLLQKRKSMLKRHYNKHFEEECQMSFVDEESSFRQEIYASIIDMLEKAETEKEIDDVDMKFNLYFPPADEFFSSGYKRPQMKSYYSDCRKAGLSSLARKFGNPDNFSSLVTLNKVGMDNVEDPEESLEEIASTYKCETFQSSEAVLKGARHMAALMISCEVPFRKHVRSLFMHNALVSTNPTLKGSIEIDSFHEFACFKWLKDKPLLKFEDSQWLLIQKAEEEKLLQVEIKFPDNAVNELMMTCNKAYLKDGEGASTQLWNEQRKSILQDTITNLLLPSMEKDARALLNAKAKNWLLMKYGMQLWSRVSVAPYLNKDNTDAQERGVVACCWGNGKPGTAFVMLDSRGELVDVMHAGSLTLRSQNINDQQRRKNDQTRVLKFLTIHKPNVIVVGAANASCIRLKEDINEIISMMSEDSFQDASQEMNQLPAVVLGDEDLPHLYEDSEISMSQLPRQYGIVKRAVALGRYLLNPLVMVATLCGVNKEAVSWKLDCLEKFLSSDEKMEMIEWIMIDITNQVGIDVNLAIRHDWLLAPLQFVSGLGPRKAGILHKELLGGTDVRNRRDFAKFGLSTKVVFCNAVGFLKVSCDDPNLVDTAGNILDRTRIHPESYSLAEELAKAVIHKHYADADDTQLNAIECIQNDPKLLESFDLNEHANRLEEEKSEYRRATLCDIKMELLHGFKDPRSPYKEPTQDDEFCMIAGGTGSTLVEGERVQATVCRVLSRQAFCVLDSGVSGILFREDFSDDIGDISLTEKLHEGVVLTCKIKLVDKNRCQINLTCKASELKNVGEQSIQDMDPYYCQGDIILPSQQEATEKQELANKSFLPRTISHPHFQNITADQAKQFLADKAVGEYIFHPSSKGLCYLAISLKLFNDLYVHKDILEGGKSHDMKSLPGLGKTLKVGEEIFESIDEVIQNYVNPLVVHLKAFINFRKFKKGSKAEVDGLLKLEKEEFPNRIPYGFGISYEHPGVFILSYIRTTQPHHEYIAIHPKGFKFRKQIFNNVEQLVAYFQSHINDNVGRAKDTAIVGSKGGGGGACYKCGESGHMARDCSQEGGGGGRGGGRSGRGRGGGRGGGGACYKCGESGHMSRECTQEGGGGGGGGGTCYKCGESGHMARECTQEGGGGGGGGGGACYKCGESGHMARDCTQEGGGGGGGGRGGGGACYKCGESGHMARDCTQEGGGGRGGGGGGGGACYKCGESGHMARDCSQGGGGGGACYKCGESGHMARDCSQENGGGGGWSGGGGRGGGGTCYKCGESGHMARDCTQGSDYNDTGNGRGAGFRGSRGRSRGRGRGFGSSSHSGDDSISDVNDGGNGWGGSGGGSGWGGAGGKSWGGKSTTEEGNIAEGSWGLKAASNAGTGNENSGWGGAQENNVTPSDGGSGWGGTGGKSWGGSSSNEESKTAKSGWGLTAASNADSGNDNSGWNSANGKNATTSGSNSGWEATGGKSWGGNNTNEESKTEKGGWGGTGGESGSGLGGTGGKSWGGNNTNKESKTEKGGWGGTGGGSDSGLGGTGGKSWGGNASNEENKIAKGGWGGGSGSGWGGTGGGGNSTNEESKKEKGGWGGGSDSGLGGTGGKSWGGNTANEESKIEKGGWGGGSDSGWGGAGENTNEASKTAKGSWGGGSDSGWGETGGKSWGGDNTNEEHKAAKGGWGGGSDSGWGGTSGKSWGGNSTNDESSIAEGGGGGYGGGGRGGGRGGRSGGGACYKCGESGHMARDCSQASEGGGRGGGSGRGGRGGGSCYNCGESGHMARECSQSSGGGGRGGRGGGACYKCGESGHMARDCSNQDNSGGGWRGGGGQGGGRGSGGGACFKCGESGHMARDCSQSGGGGGGRFGGSSGNCYKCGESGHFARECPASTN